MKSVHCPITGDAFGRLEYDTASYGLAVCVASGVIWTTAPSVFRLHSVGDSLELSGESSSHHRTGRDTDKTVLSCEGVMRLCCVVRLRVSRS